MEERSFISSEEQEVKRSATILCLDTPEGSEFGIDDYEFTCGPSFKGIKLIPPGVHFIFYSAGAKYGGLGPPRSGIFLNLKSGQVKILKWNSKDEDFDLDEELDEEEMQRYAAGVERFDFDRFLGPYPKSNSDGNKWTFLSAFINEEVISQLEPKGKRISSLYDASDPSLEEKMEEQLKQLKTSRVKMEEKSVEMNRDPQFSVIPTNKQYLGSHMDKSAIFEKLEKRYKGTFGLLGELQFAFVIFLLGQSYNGFEQWKQLLNILCSCESALKTHPHFFSEFIAVLHYQLKQIPEDFFEDVISSNNFLTNLLKGFVEITDEEGLDKKLRGRASKFEKYLIDRFGKTFIRSNDFDSDDEYAPVIVEM